MCVKNNAIINANFDSEFIVYVQIPLINACVDIASTFIYIHTSYMQAAGALFSGAIRTTVSIHCAPEMSEIDCIGRIKSFWPKFVRGW